jgi:hypothetical protein
MGDDLAAHIAQALFQETYRLLGLQRKSLTVRTGLALGESQAFPAKRHSCRVSYRAGKVTSVGEPHP